MALLDLVKPKLSDWTGCTSCSMFWAQIPRLSASEDGELEDPARYRGGDADPYEKR